MSRDESNRGSTAELPAARVFVLGLRKHGTSEVIAALRSLDRDAGLEAHPPRVFEVPTRPGVVMIANDFGPNLGAARLLSLETPKRRFALYECVDGAQSLLMAGSARCDAALWVHSALDDVELDPISAMLDAARLLGARRALVFVTDREAVSDARRDAVERDARELLAVADFDADECPVFHSSGAIALAQGERWRDGVRALRDALEDDVPYAQEDTLAALWVDDVFSIRGRGTVTTGSIAAGTIRVGETLDWLDSVGARRSVQIAGIEMIRRLVESARRPDSVGLLVRAVSERGEPLQEPLPRPASGDLLVSRGRGTFGRVIELRGHSWAASDARDELVALLPSGRTRARVRFASPALSTAGSFRLALEFERALPWLDDQSIMLRNDARVFAACFVERVIE